MIRPEDFEALGQADREQEIAKAKAEMVHFGFCQGCGHKIVALLKDWPKNCPRCGFG